MFVKNLKTGQFWIIKVVSFKISNPDSLEVKNCEFAVWSTPDSMFFHNLNENGNFRIILKLAISKSIPSEFSINLHVKSCPRKITSRSYYGFSISDHLT